MMDTFRKFVVLIVTCQFVKHKFVSGATFETRPENTHFLLSSGEKLVIPCSIVDLRCAIMNGSYTCEYIQWIKSADNGVDVLLAVNDTLQDTSSTKYSIEGEYNLVINDVSLEDAGSYYCQNSLEPRATGYMEVIVLGKKI